MFARKFEPLIFGFLLSGGMSFLVSGIATLRSVGIGCDFTGIWIGAWLMAWMVAFPAVLIAAPLVRRITQRLVSAR